MTNNDKEIIRFTPVTMQTLEVLNTELKRVSSLTIPQNVLNAAHHEFSSMPYVQTWVKLEGTKLTVLHYGQSPAHDMNNESFINECSKTFTNVVGIQLT